MAPDNISLPREYLEAVDAAVGADLWDTASISATPPRLLFRESFPHMHYVSMRSNVA